MVVLKEQFATLAKAKLEGKLPTGEEPTAQEGGGYSQVSKTQVIQCHCVGDFCIGIRAGSRALKSSSLQVMVVLKSLWPL